MKKLLISTGLLLTVCGVASADTTYHYNAGTDVVKTTTPVDTIWGYDAEYYITVPNPLPSSSSYTFSITGKNIIDSSSIDNISGLQVRVNDGLGGTLVSGAASGDTSGTFTAPASGSVTFALDPVLIGDCTPWGRNCRIPHLNESLVVPVSSASVNLNIVRLENLLNSFFSLFTVDIASAGGQ